MRQWLLQVWVVLCGIFAFNVVHAQDDYEYFGPALYVAVTF
jgi:hypothetical protein